jgi:high frequency lysogenization protein
MQAEMARELQQTLALAGVAQSAFLVHQLARHGVIAQDKLNTAVNSLFVTHPKHTQAVFGSIGILNLGLQVLQELQSTSATSSSPADVLRYLLGLLYLEHRLAGKIALLDTISERLAAIRLRHPDSQPGANTELIKELSRLYQATLSTLPYRIQVRGDLNYLKNEHVSDQIRTLLFAGVRAAVLWRQVGGKRWHLLLRRRRIARDLEALLQRRFD